MGDLSLSPDIFGLRAFNDKLPLARMLPVSNLRELRLLLPDSKIGMDGSPTWRSSNVMPADVTALRRRWPRAVFRTMQKQAKKVERLHRFARHRLEWAFRHNVPGFCSICNVEVESALDVHMTGYHLELGQL